MSSKILLKIIHSFFYSPVCSFICSFVDLSFHWLVCSFIFVYILYLLIYVVLYLFICFCFIRLWLYIGGALIGVNLCVGCYCVIWLSYYKKITDWEKHSPYLIPIATASFLVGMIW